MSGIILHFLLQDDRGSETVQKLDANMRSSFDKFKDTSLDTKNAGLYCIHCLYIPLHVYNHGYCRGSLSSTVGAVLCSLYLIGQ